jgi:hypothetical protein
MRKHIKQLQKQKKMLCGDGGRYDAGEGKVCESKSAVATDRDDFGVCVRACVRACVRGYVGVCFAGGERLAFANQAARSRLLLLPLGM